MSRICSAHGSIRSSKHALVRLAKTIAWRFIEARCGEVYSDGPGMPPLPTRLMAGLAILKHTFDLSDEELCARWIENPYFQYFCGEVVFRHELPFDRSSLTRWRQRLGEEQIAALLQESLSVAHRTGAIDTSRTGAATISLAAIALDHFLRPWLKRANFWRERANPRSVTAPFL